MIYYAVFQGKNCFVGMAKKEPFRQSNPNPITEPGDLWFEFGKTKELALEKIRAEMERNDGTKN